MEDFLELAKTRQSCRDYLDKPVEREKLERIIEAARLAPSACNSQPWSFVVVETPATVAEVADSTTILGINKYLKSATAFIVVLEETAELIQKLAQLVDSQTHAQGDLGAAVLSLCLEAESLGLGTCIAGVFDRPRLRKLLDIPPEKKIFMVVAVGYPKSERVREKSRKPFAEIVRFV
ncbi:MAG: nitroreductase family protein [Deltaproteobacteria bacterium]|jgi:nitroreductase|nr:nitroreductase family protein [Deltaproteobacteria bacterium]